MFATTAAQAALGRNTPTPSFDGPTAVREPSILEEVARLQKETLDMARSAIDRTIGLRERLVGKTINPEVNVLQEGLRFPPDGQLGQAYHEAWQLRQNLMQLHHELGQLEYL